MMRTKGLKMGLRASTVFLIVLQILQFAGLAAGCPQSCDCTKVPDGVIVECRDQDFYQVPEGFPANTVEIDLSHNDIPVIASSTFPQLTKMRKLVMENCNIKRLESYALIAFPQLENITLTDNVIATMGTDALRNLPNLKYVHLENNELETIPSLEGLNLVDLHLAGNRLTDMSFHASSIVNLNLNNNEFTKLSASDIAPLKGSIKSFQLAHNRKQLTVDSDTFQGIQLESLSLRNNSLHDNSFLRHVTTSTLDISGNPFDSLDFSSYYNLDTVEVLYAQDIPIDFLDQETLWPFIGLKYLNLANTSLLMFKGKDFNHMNKLHTLVLEDNPFIMLPNDLGTNLPSLRELLLARCHVMTLNGEIFKDMVNLTSLDARNNKVQVLAESLKPVLQRLSFLGLEGNPLHCNCEMLWFWQWQQSQSNNASYSSNYTCNSPVKMPLLEATVDNFKCSRPTFINAKSDITALVGTDVYLTCIAEGDPPPEVEWEAPTGEILRITPSYNRTMYKTYAIWRLKRVQLPRAGVYKCRARNVLISVTADTQLHILTSLDPNATQVPSNVSRIEPTTMSTTTEAPTTVPTSSSSSSTTLTVTTTTQLTVTLPSYNTSYTNNSMANFSVVLETSELPGVEGALNLTDAITDNDVTKNEKNPMLVKIIIIVCCAVALILVIVCVIVIVRQRQHSQKYDVSTTSFDNSNREHLTNGLNHKPITPVVEVGEEKQKLTEV